MSAGANTATGHSWVRDFFLLAAIWGSSFLFTRLGASEFGALPTAGVRVALATLFLFPIMVQRGHWPALRDNWPRVLMAGVINSAIPFALYAWAIMHITTGLASILNATVPLFGAIVAWLWLGDRIGRLRSFGLALGFVGVALLAWRAPGGAGGKSDLAYWAVVACLGATAFYAVAASYARRYLMNLPPLATATGSQLGAALFLAIPTVLSWPEQMPGLRPWLAVITLAILCTGIAYILYFRLIVTAGPSRAVAVTFLAPVFAVVYGLVFLGEDITPWMVGCAVVIVLGTLLSTGLISRRKRPAASPPTST